MSCAFSLQSNISFDRAEMYPNCVPHTFCKMRLVTFKLLKQVGFVNRYSSHGMTSVHSIWRVWSIPA